MTAVRNLSLRRNYDIAKALLEATDDQLKEPLDMNWKYTTKKGRQITYRAAAEGHLRKIEGKIGSGPWERSLDQAHAMVAMVRDQIREFNDERKKKLLNKKSSGQ